MKYTNHKHSTLKWHLTYSPYKCLLSKTKQAPKSHKKTIYLPSGPRISVSHHRSRPYLDYISDSAVGERSDRILGHLVRYDNPMPQESFDMPPQVEARQHRLPTRSESNKDFESISRQLSSSSEEGCPVVIPSQMAASVEKQSKRGSHWWDRSPPSGVIESLVHMAFTIS